MEIIGKSLRSRYFSILSVTSLIFGVLLLIAGNVDTLHAQCDPKVKVMPLGDSITDGDGGSYDGYRGYLYDSLDIGNDGVPDDVEFVGSLSSNHGDHEGHGG